MQSVSIKKHKVAKTTKEGVELDERGRKIDKRHVISSGSKMLVSVGIKVGADIEKISGTATIFDDDQAVLEIDKKKLAVAIKELSSKLEVDGIKRLYEVPKLAVKIGYKPTGALGVEGDYDDLLFWFE